MPLSMHPGKRDDVANTAAASARRVARSAPGDRVSYLTPVRELSAFRFGPDRVDVRHRPVLTGDGRLVGILDRLFVETATGRVRYAAIALDLHAADDQRPNRGGTVLVPIGVVRRLDEHAVLTLSGLTAQMLVDAPRLPARPVTRADELAALAVYGMDHASEASRAMYGDPSFDERPALDR